MRQVLVLCCLVCVFAGCQTGKAAKQNPQDIQSVLSEVKKSFNVQDTQVKYCPTCGKHYSGHLDQCPDDHAKLILIE